MRKMFRKILSMMLVLTTLFCATVTVFAAGADEEEYLSDLRIIYADNYNEALEILEESGLEGYKIFNSNLNENTKKIGVWLAYKSTTDIEDAITDIAVMQMNGGYNEGNYQEMIKQSYAEYVAMGENYETAIEYFAKAYNEGHYLSDIAYRQLNFYNVVTEGIDDIPDFEGERLGDIFVDGIEATDLATMFMEGNSYALDNIRSLIAMGVSYNEDGLTYLEKVADEAEKMNADSDVYSNKDYNELAAIIAPTIITFGDMFKELEVHSADLNYEDDEITELEIKYMEYMVMAVMMKEVTYLGDKTLYDFCINYTLNKEDYSTLYPLVAALNEGQEAMTRVAHFYDVVRYSMTLEADEEIEAELAAMEEEYSEYPFNIYTGVDRTIYRDTFALTSEAYRADAYTEDGLSAALYNGNLSTLNIAATVVGSVGAAVLGAGLIRYGYLKWGAKKAANTIKEAETALFESYQATQDYFGIVGTSVARWRPIDVVDKTYEILQRTGEIVDENFVNWTFQEKFNYLDKFYTNAQDYVAGADDFNLFKAEVSKYVQNNEQVLSAKVNAEAATASLNNGMGLVYGLYIAGGIMMIASAITLGISVYNYYNPTYDDIPTAMVDLIDTVDGDRYIKYDVVYEAEAKADGNYAAGDLNAFKAQRWNALYYTKSYEAGKPLLADEFVVSNNNNTPAKNYAPVHRFGEVVSYNLNKYNFNDDCSIYLSVKQSENQKSAVADVPEVVGSLIGTGFYFLAGGIGIILGVCGTIATQKLLKIQKKKKEDAVNTATDALND